MMNKSSQHLRSLGEILNSRVLNIDPHSAKDVQIIKANVAGLKQKHDHLSDCAGSA
jgi:hypothetical protein